MRAARPGLVALLVLLLLLLLQRQLSTTISSSTATANITQRQPVVTAAAELEVVWRLPGHDTFNYSAFVDRCTRRCPCAQLCAAQLMTARSLARSLFTPDQQQWLQHYKGSDRRASSTNARPPGQPAKNFNRAPRAC